MSNGNRDRQCALQTIRLVDDEPDAHTKMSWIVNEIATHFFYSSALQVCLLSFFQARYICRNYTVCVGKKRDYIGARECETKKKHKYFRLISASVCRRSVSSAVAESEGKRKNMFKSEEKLRFRWEKFIHKKNKGSRECWTCISDESVRNRVYARPEERERERDSHFDTNKKRIFILFWFWTTWITFRSDYETLGVRQHCWPRYVVQ